jgi:phage-related protein
VSAIGALGSTLFSKGKDLLDGLWDGVKNVWTSVKEWFEGIPGKVKSAIGDLGSALYQKGRDLIDGFVNGIKSMGNAILNAILSLLPNSIEGIVRKAIGFSGGVGAPAVSSFSARSSRSLDGGSHAPVVTDEQLARAVYSLLMRSGIRNGVQTAVVL